MLNLDTKLTVNQALVESANLCSSFSDPELSAIGSECWEGYDADERSREIWLKRNEAGMDLALQVQKAKTFPWAGCANVAFPLITIAAMQFHARAYPSIIAGEQLVKCNIFGPDPEGEQAARSARIQTHMSWQLLYEDRPWEEQTDKAIFNLSIVGTNFKKTYYSHSLRHNVSELVLAKDLVLNYWSKSLDATVRKTHIVPKFRNEVHENVLRGLWRDCLEESWYTAQAAPQSTTAQQREDERQGVTAPRVDSSTDFLFLEQHICLDLDGDGYAEPYIVTVEKTSRYVVRIVANFDSMKDVETVAAGPRKGQIIQITPKEYFTKYTFIPSPDGGIYDIGFGVFLGPLNESVNSLVNMLLDAGSMQTTAGGFLGRGAKIRGGTYEASPFEWKRVDSTGDDLRKSIFPLPVNAPSDVLFQLLSLLITYASRVSGTTDTTVGENPGQNTPAQTTQTMVEMGQKVYTAIFKRVWRSTKEEFRKLFLLNGIHVSEKPGIAQITQLDYLIGADLIAPIADPSVSSESARIQQAITVRAASKETPGYNADAVEKRFLQALRVEDIPSIFPGTQGQPPPTPEKVQIQQAKDAGAKERLGMTLQAQQQLDIATLMEEQRLNNAKIVGLMASAEESSANAQSEQQYAQVALINAQLTMAKHENDKLTSRIASVLKAAEIQSRHKIGMKQQEATA